LRIGAVLNVGLGDNGYGLPTDSYQFLYQSFSPDGTLIDSETVAGDMPQAKAGFPFPPNVLSLSKSIDISVGGHISVSFSIDGEVTASPTQDCSAEVGANLSLYAELLTPDITPTKPTFDATDGGVDYGYTISGADLPQATTVDLDWASGTTVDTVIGSPITSTTTETAQGTYSLHATPAQLGAPPPGAEDLLVVVDPNNTISPADPSKIASLALPDIAATSLTWASDGGVDYGYSISSADLPQATTVDLDWASGTTTDTEVGAPIVITTTETAQGTYPLQVSRSALGDAPVGANYLLEVADPDNVISASDPDKVTTLALPTLSITQLEWNTDRNGSLQDSSHRGIDFGYTIAGSNLPLATTIDFYWASGITTGTIISPVVDESNGAALAAGQQPSPSFFTLETAIGVYTYDPSNQATFTSHNDPARWGAPPAGANYILAVADPLDLIVKVSETPLNSVASLPLATAQQVLDGSVANPTVNGGAISTTFTPGSGTGLDIPMSEAEVVLGVDHFNWYQQLVYAPTYWYPYTLEDVDYSNLDHVGVNALGQFGYSDTGQTIVSQAKAAPITIGSPLIDPIVTNSPLNTWQAYTRAFIVQNPDFPGQTTYVA